MDTKQVQQLCANHFPQLQPLLAEFEAARTNTGTLPKVVVYGVYNSGKSSLLNSLTRHIEQEYFATRDIPETKKVKSLQQEGIEYIDTPGLDVNSDDNAAAQQGISQADLLLFVHKLSAGPIQASELRTMEQLIASHGRPNHVWLVITKAEQAAQNQSLIADIQQQFQALAPKSKAFLVSNTTFAKGVTQSKQRLIEHSGMLVLLDELMQWRNRTGLELADKRKQKTAHLRQLLLDQLDAQLLAVERQQQLEKISLDNYVKLFVKDIQQLQAKAVLARLQS